MRKQYLLVGNSKIYRYQAPARLIEWDSFDIEMRRLNITLGVKKLFTYNFSVFTNLLNKVPAVKLGKDIIAVWSTKLD